jgi:medium-chain acyl-[acyl-carrier-protein] hydrolase
MRYCCFSRQDWGARLRRIYLANWYELMELLLPLLRADFELCQTYRYQHEPPLDCPFFVFSGFDDADITQENLLVWRTQTTYPMRLQMFSGDHFFILNSQQEPMQIISQRLSQIINERCDL